VKKDRLLCPLHWSILIACGPLLIVYVFLEFFICPLPLNYDQPAYGPHLHALPFHAANQQRLFFALVTLILAIPLLECGIKLYLTGHPCDNAVDVETQALY
jgi:hypothetical protein